MTRTTPCLPPVSRGRPQHTCVLNSKLHDLAECLGSGIAAMPQRQAGAAHLRRDSTLTANGATAPHHDDLEDLSECLSFLRLQIHGPEPGEKEDL